MSSSEVETNDAAPVEAEASPADGAPPHSNAKRRTIEWLVIVAVALVVALLLRVFVVQSFYIPSASMSPTLQVGDRILVNKLAYHLHGVGRGDIIVFRAPPKVASTCDTTDQDLVKRVIGLPGETISRMEVELRPRLFRDGTWILDYRRLRIVAQRL